MFDPENALRRVLGWRPSSSVGKLADGTGSSHERPEIAVARKFGSTEHLASEAVAAFADGELRMGAYQRAAAHLSICADCAREVETQQQARAALRRAAVVSVPASLLGALSQIPRAHREFGTCDFPRAAAGDTNGTGVPRYLPATTPGEPLGGRSPITRGQIIAVSAGTYVSVLKPEQFGVVLPVKRRPWQRRPAAEQSDAGRDPARHETDIADRPRF